MCLFPDFQYGFRFSWSTADLLTVVSDRIAWAFNRPVATRAVALDISIGLITLVVLIWKWMGLFLTKNHFLRWLGWLTLLNWITALTLYLLLKLPSRKLEPQYLIFFSLLRLLCISINLPYTHVWNIVVMSGLVPLVSTLSC